MEHKLLPEGIHSEDVEDMKKRLTLKWFNETQAPFICKDGNVPCWFQGFIARKDAEHQLREKDLGCFLIRLSDKAIGYILSYKGRDRCRHFVINQNNSGHYIISGDTETHSNLADLIQYYKISPIEPFGEFLTSPCSEMQSPSDLYDVVQASPGQKPGVSVKAVRNLWSHWSEPTSEQPPALPPKTNRKLTATTSLDNPAPPVPKRGSSPKTSTHQTDIHSDLNQVIIRKNTKQAMTYRGSIVKSRAELNTEYSEDEDPLFQSLNISSFSRGPSPGISTIYSELSLVECRSRSLPLLDDSCLEEHYKLKPSSNQAKKTSSNAMSLQHQDTSQETSSDLTSSNILDTLSPNPIYHISGKFQGSHSFNRSNSQPQAKENMYAEVPCASMPNHMVANKIYEQIPNLDFRSYLDAQSNTYETLEDLQSKSHGGKKNDKWRRFFPGS